MDEEKYAGGDGDDDEENGEEEEEEEEGRRRKKCWGLYWATYKLVLVLFLYYIHCRSTCIVIDLVCVLKARHAQQHARWEKGGA